MGKEMTSYLRIMVINCMAVFILAGCAATQMEVTESGFLSGYSGMVEDEEYEGLKVYRNPDVNIKSDYPKILIAPVKFVLDSTVKAYDLDFDDRRKLSTYYHAKLTEGLVENFEIVDKPGKNVLLFRSAITDILPSKVYLNVHWSTTLTGVGIGGASLEAELVDSLTDERILAFVDARKGRTVLNQPSRLIKNYTNGLTKWGHSKEVLGTWANIMVDNLNQMRDVSLAEERE